MCSWKSIWKLHFRSESFSVRWYNITFLSQFRRCYIISTDTQLDHKRQCVDSSVVKRAALVFWTLLHLARVRISGAACAIFLTIICECGSFSTISRGCKWRRFVKQVNDIHTAKGHLKVLYEPQFANLRPEAWRILFKMCVNPRFWDLYRSFIILKSQF